VIHAYLCIGTNNEELLLNICSVSDALHIYSTYDFDIRSIYDLLKRWQSTQDTDLPFQSMFEYAFGDGVLMGNTFYSIYMAQAYSKRNHHQDNKND
jgi:hypothetical protein